jgi:hypothetical protein
MVTVSAFSPAPSAPMEKERAAAKRQAAKDRGWKRPAAHHEEPQEWHTLNASYCPDSISTRTSSASFPSTVTGAGGCAEATRPFRPHIR